MLGGIQAGLATLDSYDDAALADAEPDLLSRQIGTLFAQFERLVHSTREFYTLSDSGALPNLDLDRGRVPGVQGCVAGLPASASSTKISRYMPQIADLLARLAPRVPVLCERANTGQRLLDIDGRQRVAHQGSRRRTGRGCTCGSTARTAVASDADGVRRLAGEAMRSLLVNLRRIAASSEREQKQGIPIWCVLPAGSTPQDDDTAHALWAAAFGLYPSRHLGFVADDDDNPVPPTTSWWQAPAAEGAP